MKPVWIPAKVTWCLPKWWAGWISPKCPLVGGRNPGWYGKYTIIYRVLYIPGGAGFLPSTVIFCNSSERKVEMWHSVYSSKVANNFRSTKVPHPFIDDFVQLGWAFFFLSHNFNFGGKIASFGNLKGFHLTPLFFGIKRRYVKLRCEFGAPFAGASVQCTIGCTRCPGLSGDQLTLVNCCIEGIVLSSYMGIVW